MRFDLPLPCQECGVRDQVSVLLMASWWEWRCPKCGHDNAVLSSEEWTLGWRVLEKAKNEYLSNDHSTSIVFSAMAVEAELARMYFKWRRIDTLLSERRAPTAHEFDDEFRRLGSTIADRIDAVARFLDPRGIDEFARTTDLAERIDGEGFPSLHLGTLARDVQEAVFWPRNRILHDGYLDHSADDAKRVHNVASVVLDLLKRLDAGRMPGTSTS